MKGSCLLGFKHDHSDSTCLLSHYIILYHSFILTHFIVYLSMDGTIENRELFLVVGDDDPQNVLGMPRYVIICY